MPLQVNNTTLLLGKITGSTLDSLPLAFGITNKALSDADYTLLNTEYINTILQFTGTLTASRNIILPLVAGAFYIVKNGTGQQLTFKGASGTGIAVATTKVAMIYCDGTNYVRFGADV